MKLGFGVTRFLGFSATCCYVVLLLPALHGCAIGGLKEADGWRPPKITPPERCIWVSDQQHAACLTPAAFQRWRKRNGV